MDDKPFTQLICDSLEYAEKLNARCEEQYGLGQIHLMDYEQDTGWMFFSYPGSFHSSQRNKS